MDTKLTLRLDEALIRRAKRHSARSGKSVSRLVADYFALIDATDATSSLRRTSPSRTSRNRRSLRTHSRTARRSRLRSGQAATISSCSSETENAVAQNVTLDMGKVKLERGGSATTFEWPDYNTDLMRCFYFYQLHLDRQVNNANRMYGNGLAAA